MSTSTIDRPNADKRGVPLDTEKIRRLRLAIPLTQEEAAARAGLSSRQKWNDIENGRRMNLSIDTLEKIAAALGCKARELLK